MLLVYVSCGIINIIVHNLYCMFISYLHLNFLHFVHLTFSLFYTFTYLICNNNFCVFNFFSCPHSTVHFLILGYLLAIAKTPSLVHLPLKLGVTLVKTILLSKLYFMFCFVIGLVGNRLCLKLGTYKTFV